MTDQPQDTTAVDEAASVDREAVGDGVQGRDGGPQDREAMAAADGLQTPPGVEESYDEMLERGAANQGEGRVP